MFTYVYTIYSQYAKLVRCVHEVSIFFNISIIIYIFKFTTYVYHNDIHFNKTTCFCAEKKCCIDWFTTISCSIFFSNITKFFSSFSSFFIVESLFCCGYIFFQIHYIVSKFRLEFKPTT